MEKWKRLFLFTTLVAYFYILMEWLFFATKPSFLNGMSVHENLSVLFISGGMTAIIFDFLFIVFLILYMLTKVHKLSQIAFYFAILPPAFLLSALILILFDNFTYTILKFGVVSTTGVWRGLYGVFTLYLVWVIFKWAIQFSKATYKSKFLSYLTAGLLISSSLFTAEQFIHRTEQNEFIESEAAKRPNILLIGSDGVNAKNMSLYGYERETTPFISDLATSSLLAENAFANWVSSKASTTSMLTGKQPQEIQFYKTHDTFLTGVASYQHLPGILRRYGYFSVQMGALNYIDAYVVNLQDAFDIANGRILDQNPIFQLARQLGLGDATYLIARIFERVSDRILHIYYIRDMTNPFSQVILNGEEVSLSDNEKIEQLIDLLNNTEQPIFAHVHLMGTHGPKFSPTKQVFSVGQEQTQDWMPDFYDDSILSFDGYIKKLYDELARSENLDNTIIVLYSDHGMGYEIQRVPFLIHFPDNEISGVVKNNVQNIDIAPTLLDYLEIPVPSWMDGYSLLRGEPPQQRLLIIGEAADIEEQRVVQCERKYQLDQKNQRWLVSELKDHTNPCHITSHITNGNPLDFIKNDIHQDVLDYFTDTANLNNELDKYPVYYLENTSNATRLEMAKLVLLYMGKSKEEIPPAKGIFIDVPQSDANASIIEYVYNQGIMDNCTESPLSFCPQGNATRQEAAFTLLRSLLGSSYVPPSATGMFADVPVASPYAPWVEEFSRRGIISRCSSSKYCPENLIPTEHLLLFLKRTFSAER